jgi:hypothetical protein
MLVGIVFGGPGFGRAFITAAAKASANGSTDTADKFVGATNRPAPGSCPAVP